MKLDIYLQGGVFEEYVYWIASEIGFDDMVASSEIIFDGSALDKTLIHNEFDLLAFKNNRLYLFECKFTKKFEMDDLIYKYMALKEHIKNDSKGIIIAVDPKGVANIQTASLNKIPPKLRKKAALFDIHILSNIFEYDQLKKELNAIVHPQGRKVIEPTKPTQKPKTYVYFLGGYDLEMFEIRKILEKHNAQFIDKSLKWGAKISDYASEIESLEADKIPVFIELENDMKIDREYVIIDHHGEYAHLPTALEQVAKRFEVKLDRFQILAAINDKSHIRGLKKYGASTSEIESIRRLDRQKQGVSIEDERLCAIALQNISQVRSLPVIKTEANHFSPISDAVNYSSYLVYNDRKLCLFTEKIKSAMALFRPYFEKKQAYYGGDKQMYFCLKEGVLSSSEIEALVQQIAKKL